jgi:hypothetical protein
MSGTPSDDMTGQVRPEGDVPDVKVETADQNKVNEMPSPQEEVSYFANKFNA